MTNDNDDTYSALLERFGEALLKETRTKVSRSEVETTWEDLYIENGVAPTVDELASWLSASKEAVIASLPKWLMVHNGKVVEKGISNPPVPGSRPPVPVFEAKKKKVVKKKVK